MYRIIALLIIFSGFKISVAVAQKDFRPGYILPQQDTLKGYVAFQNERRSGTKCIFKPQADAAVQRFNPEEIKGYGFLKGNRFEAMKLPAQEGLQETKFLQVLVKGKASLYTYQDVAANQHFYLLKGNQLKELKQQVRTEVDKRTGNKVKITEKLYLDTLKAALQDCSTITSQLVETRFKTSSLTKLVAYYNTCLSPENLTYIRPLPKTKLVWGPVLGLNTSSLKITSPGLDLYISVPDAYQAKLKPSGGIFLNINFPRIIDKVSLQLEATYTSNKYTAEFQQAGQFGRNNNYKVNFDLNYIKVPVLFRYTVPNGQIRPFFNAGILNAYAVKFHQNSIKESTLNNTTYIDETPALISYRKYNQGFIIGAGTNLYYSENYTLGVEGRFERMNSLSAASAILAAINTFYLQMSLGF